MSRTPELVLSLSFSIQPGGWALPADPASNWGQMLLPMASAWSAIEASMESMLPQVDPRQAVQLLPAWERMLGSDPCGRDLLATTQAEQQALVYQRLTARGGQSIPYFIGLAAALGVTVTVREGTWTRTGAMRTGAARLSAPGNQFNWQVTMPTAVTTSQFRTGASRAGDRLGSFTQSVAQCPIAHAAPAHTIVAFNYSGIPTHG